MLGSRSRIASSVASFASAEVFTGVVCLSSMRQMPSSTGMETTLPSHLALLRWSSARNLDSFIAETSVTNPLNLAEVRPTHTLSNDACKRASTPRHGGYAAHVAQLLRQR